MHGPVLETRECQKGEVLFSSNAAAVLIDEVDLVKKNRVIVSTPIHYNTVAA